MQKCHTHKHTHTYTHTHIHTHRYIHTQIYTHTRTLTNDTLTYTLLCNQKHPSCAHYKHTHSCTDWRASKGKSNPHPMVSNPLYEGPVYETIDPQFQPLTPCTDTPNYPAIESNSAAVLNVEAVLPLNGSVTVAVSTDTIARSEDNYTVMCSARATAAPVQPNNDNNTIRYVQDPSGR